MATPSISSALVRKRDDTDLLLMPPPPPTKKIKRPKEVLDEDTYTEALSRIIARDFFPGLLRSETQQEYLDALESKDENWIDSAGRRLHHVMTPGRRVVTSSLDAAGAIPHRIGSITPGGQTPVGYAGATPIHAVESSPPDRMPGVVATNMSLGAFQMKYTSEDNESFYKVLDRQNERRAAKYAWLWRGNKLPSKQQLKQMEVRAKEAKTRGLLDNGFTNTKLTRNDTDDRPATLDMWKSDPQNTLMFRPDGVEDSLETVAQRAEAASKAAPKSVVYANTRLPDPNITFAPARPTSPTMSAVQDALRGRPRPGDRDSTMSGSETPRVNGYAFVDDEEPEAAPTPKPAPLMIDLGPGDTTPNPFKLQEQRKREGIHHRMVDKIAQAKRTSVKNGMVGQPDRTPAPQYPNSPRVHGGLTPAAQRLWSKIGTPRQGPGVTPFDGKATPRKSRTAVLRGGP